MNEAERLSLEIRRKALEVFDGKSEELELQKILHLIERNQPEILEAVVKQLEEDNGRWSDNSGFPNAKVGRDGNGRVQTVTFEALGKMQADGKQEILSIIWRSDHSEIAWVETFTKELLNKEEKSE
jgi:hypothetical protein